MVTVALLVGLIAIRHATYASSGVHASAATQVAVAVATAVVAVVLVWYGSRRSTHRLVFASLAVVLVALELLTYQNHRRPGRTSVLDPTPPYLAYLYEHLGAQRTLNAGNDALVPNWGEATGIRQIETLDVMQIPWYRDFYQDVHRSHGGAVPDDHQSRAPRRSTQIQPRSTCFRSSTWCSTSSNVPTSVVWPPTTNSSSGIARPKWTSSKTWTAFPRAFLSPALAHGLVLPGSRHWTQATTVTDDRQLLTEARHAQIPSGSASARLAGSATITQDDSTIIRIHVHATRPSVLVLADTYHPNWTATIDGRPSPGRAGRLRRPRSRRARWIVHCRVHVSLDGTQPQAKTSPSRNAPGAARRLRSLGLRAPPAVT